TAVSHGGPGLVPLLLREPEDGSLSARIGLPIAAGHGADLVERLAAGDVVELEGDGAGDPRIELGLRAQDLAEGLQDLPHVRFRDLEIDRLFEAQYLPG